MINSKKIIASVVAALMCVNICTVNAYALNQEKKVLTMENIDKEKQISINYSSEYNNSEFKVNYLKATKVNDEVEFELSYESPEDSDFSFFNPPNGDKLVGRIYDGIKEGKNITKFNITEKDFQKALQGTGITICFGGNSNLGWIFFDNNELERINNGIYEEDDNKYKEVISEENLVFGEEYENEGFKVNSLKARRFKNSIEFELSYESPEDSNLIFFSSSNDDTLIKRIYDDGIKEGKNIAKFKLTQTEVEKVLQSNSIIMRFGWRNNLGSIFISKDQIEKIDNNIVCEDDEEVLLEKDLEFNEQYENEGFKVNSLKAIRFKNSIEFELSYVSPENSDISFFNPPKGNKLMKVFYGSIKKQKNTTKFKLTQKEFENALQSNSITMRFGFRNTLGWIFIEKDQFQSLMNNTNETVKKTGWISVENKEHKKNWYYIFEDGTKAYGWQLINGAWYYFDSENDGLMIENQFVDSNSDKYYLDENGSMIMNKWLDTDNGWVYFQHNGSSARDWAYINGVWYYFDSNGIMLKGWNYINGTWYYFYGSGAMAVNVVIDGWKVNGSGVATPF